MPADGPSRNSSSARSSSTSSATASRESSDSMSMCRCAPRSRAWRRSARNRTAASRLPRSGASGRSSGVSAETFTDRFARGRGPTWSASSAGRGGSFAYAATSVSSASAQRAAYRSASGAVIVASPRRSTDVATPSRHRSRITPSASLRRLADDEAVGHVAHACGGGRAQRGAPGLRPAHPHGHLERRWPVRDVVQEPGEVAREVVERAAGGRDVHEPEERGAQLVVLGGEVHRLRVERLERVARRRGERRGEVLADLEDRRVERSGARAGTGIRLSRSGHRIPAQSPGVPPGPVCVPDPGDGPEGEDGGRLVVRLRTFCAL